MSKAKQAAKTASKNNPLTRESGREFFHNEKKIIPVDFRSKDGKYIAAQYVDSGDMVVDANGRPLPWSRLIH